MTTTTNHQNAAQANDRAAQAHDDAQHQRTNPERSDRAHHETARAIGLTRDLWPDYDDATAKDAEIRQEATECATHDNNNDHRAAAAAHRRLAAKHREAERVRLGMPDATSDHYEMAERTRQADIARWQAAEAKDRPEEGHAAAELRGLRPGASEAEQEAFAAMIEANRIANDAIAATIEPFPTEPIWDEATQEAHIAATVTAADCPICQWEDSLTPEQAKAHAAALEGEEHGDCPHCHTTHEGTCHPATFAERQAQGPDPTWRGPSTNDSKQAWRDELRAALARAAEALAMCEADEMTEDEINPFNKESK